VAALIFSGWLASGCVGEATVSQIGESGGHWDPCPSLLDGDTGSGKPPNKEAGPYAWGGFYCNTAELRQAHALIGIAPKFHSFL
jgi:hypothetical protein